MLFFAFQTSKSKSVMLAFRLLSTGYLERWNVAFQILKQIHFCCQTVTAIFHYYNEDLPILFAQINWEGLQRKWQKTSFKITALKMNKELFINCYSNQSTGDNSPPPSVPVSPLRLFSRSPKDSGSGLRVTNLGYWHRGLGIGAG